MVMSFCYWMLRLWVPTIRFAFDRGGAALA
jgi:hypothetical protein